MLREEGITTTALIEERNGQLSLIRTSPRGGKGDTLGADKRVARSLIVPHLQRESKIYADEVQNVWAFGSESELQAVQAIVNGRLAALRRTSVQSRG